MANNNGGNVCPKCGIIAQEQSGPQEPANPKTVKKQWIALIVLIPVSILLIMGIITLYFKVLH